MRGGIVFAAGMAALASLALSGGNARAQDESPPEAAVEAAAEDAAAVMQRLEAEYKTARSEYSKSRRAQPKGSTEPREPKPRAEEVMWPKYRDAAAQFTGTPEAATFLVRTIQYAMRHEVEASHAALDTLIADHAGNKVFTDLTFTFLYYADQLGEERVAKAMSASIAAHDGVTAAMLYARGARVLRRKFDDPAARDEALAAALVDLNRASDIAPESTYGKRAESTIFEIERLQIGMAAPDVEGEDLDGVAFKLSDYLGKVVVLDFWGDW